MNRIARKALKESIAHWYRISDCTTPEDLETEGYESDSCALCREFDPCPWGSNYLLTEAFAGIVRCKGCPVREATGRRGCNGTPYYHAVESLDVWLISQDWYNTDQQNVEDEIRFLESLL